MKFNQNIFAKDTVKIGNLDWDVLMVDDCNQFLYDNGAKAKDTDPSEGAFGMTYVQNQEIYISKDMPKGNFKRTIIHELTHAVFYTYALSVERRKLTEEEICNLMEIHSEEIVDLGREIYKKFFPEYSKLKKVA